MATEFHPDEQRIFLEWMQTHFERPFKCTRFRHAIEPLLDAAERVEIGSRSLVVVTCPSCGCVEWIDPKLPKR
jgi:hypothetical protein